MKIVMNFFPEDYDDEQKADEDSGDESDIEDNDELTFPAQRRESNPVLPDTVSVLESPSGSKVYLVGTAHFSLESQEDVANVIVLAHIFIDTHALIK